MPRFLHRFPSLSELSFRGPLASVLFCVLILLPGILSATPPRYDEALARFKDGDHNGSLEIVRSVFDENRESLELRMLAAACYHRLGNLDSALAHMLYALKSHPDEVGPTLYMAILQREKGQPGRAVEILKRGAGKFPQDPWVRYELAATYFSQGNHKVARQQLEAVLTKSPNFFPAVYLDGVIYLADGDYENADFRFRNATRIRMTDREWTKRLYNNLGIVNEHLAAAAGDAKVSAEKISLARDYFKKAIELDGGYSIARGNLDRLH